MQLLPVDQVRQAHSVDLVHDPIVVGGVPSEPTSGLEEPNFDPVPVVDGHVSDSLRRASCSTANGDNWDGVVRLISCHERKRV